MEVTMKRLKYVLCDCDDCIFEKYVRLSEYYTEIKTFDIPVRKL